MTLAIRLNKAFLSQRFRRQQPLPHPAGVRRARTPPGVPWRSSAARRRKELWLGWARKICWRQMATAPDPNVIRIFFSTDNHLGFNEKDPVRGDDSFIAFEEVLEKCIESKVRTTGVGPVHTDKL